MCGSILISIFVFAQTWVSTVFSVGRGTSECILICGIRGWFCGKVRWNLKTELCKIWKEIDGVGDNIGNFFIESFYVGIYK